MTKLRHYDNLGTARFVTFSCCHKIKYFTFDRVFKIFIRFLKEARNTYDFNIYGYVIMPDHIHLVIHPMKIIKLGLVIREIKSKTARQYFKEFPALDLSSKRVFWQLRCYDHNCRSKEIVLEKIRYCHYNPVVGGRFMNHKIGYIPVIIGIMGKGMCR